MRKIFLILTTLTASVANAQTKHTEFPGTGFGFVLPDSGYTYGDNKFYNKESSVTFFFINPEADFGNIKYNDFVSIMMKELSKPGITVLSDKVVSADSNRIMKTVINYDVTDEKPATKGRRDINWFYFYNYKQKPIVLLATYPLELDDSTGENILKSFQSFTNSDKKIIEDSLK